MKRITKAKQKSFIKLATDIILSKGAESVEPRYESTEFELSTKAGNLIITIPEDQEYVLTVFMRFDEPPRANDMFRSLSKSTEKLNQFSGKYNVHHFDEVNALDSIKQHLSLLN